MTLRPTANTSRAGLVVHEDPSERRRICGFVERIGLQPLPFSASDEAARAMIRGLHEPSAEQANQPALVVASAGMPGLDGWSLCRLMRSPSCASLNQVPVILIDPAVVPVLVPSSGLAPCGWAGTPVDEAHFVDLAQRLIRNGASETPGVLLAGLAELVERRSARALEEGGFRVQSAPTFSAASALLADTTFDALVVSHDLPDGKAIDLIEAFSTGRSHGASILLGPAANAGETLEWMIRGLSAQVDEAIDPAALVRLCQCVLQERSQHRALGQAKPRLHHLRETEQTFRLIAENASDGLLVFSADHQVQYASPAYAAELGFSDAGAVDAATIRERMHPDDRERVVGGVLEAIASRAPNLRYTYRARHVDGHHIWREDYAQFVYDEAGRHVRSYVLCRNVTRTKLTEEALARSQAELAAIYDHAPVMMCLVNAQRNVVYANRAFSDFTGIAQSSLAGGPACGAFGCIHAEDDPKGCGHGPDCRDCGFRLALVDTFATGEEHRNVECRATWMRDDRYSDFDILASTALIQHGGEPRVLLCLHDITERKRAERALRESEERFRTLADTVPVLVWMSGPDKGCNYFNKVWLDFTGRSLEQETGDGWVQGVHPDDLARCIHVYEHSFEARRPFEMAYRLRRHDGEYRWVHDAGVPRFDSKCGFLGYVGGCIDFTDHMRAKEALRANQQLLAAIVENAEDSIFVKDPSLRFVKGNTATAASFGVAVEDLIGKSTAELLGREQAREIEEADRRVLAGETVKQHETNWVDGVTKHLHTIKAPLRDEQGNVIGLCGISRDVTEQHRADQERSALEAQLQHAQRLESVGRLAGGVAHDFNNTLAAILGYADLILGQVPRSSPIHGDVEEIRAAAQRSADLTRQLLTFARKQTVVPQRLDLNTAVPRTLKMIRRLVGEDIQISWNPSASPCPVKLDPVQLDQVLTNLSVNARDAICDVGVLELSTERLLVPAEDNGQHPGVPGGQFVLLKVKDNGRGMDEETRSRVFEPFFTTKPVGEGTGLGLATVYGAVRQSDGFVRVDSHPGKGTTFSLYFPYAERELDDVPPSEPSPTQGGNETILLVEDRFSVLKLCGTMLEKLGYTVLSADAPREALRLEQAYPGPVDLLITDVIMPEMNGRSLAEELRRRRPGIKCLFISGFAAEVLSMQATRDDVVVFLQKPFTQAALAAKVRAALMDR